MDRILLKNLYNGRYVVASFLGITLLTNWSNMHHLVQNDIFGYDGNGGDITKIITNLTDEEMARLKYARRTTWHFRGMRKGNQGNAEPILEQELADREIDWPKEPYIEYVKRPPHDKYL